eukprot:scaffold9845_cov63-Phaeocystis_antarctica.AAC.6
MTRPRTAGTSRPRWPRTTGTRSARSCGCERRKNRKREVLRERGQQGSRWKTSRARSAASCCTSRASTRAATPSASGACTRPWTHWQTRAARCAAQACLGLSNPNQPSRDASVHSH